MIKIVPLLLIATVTVALANGDVTNNEVDDGCELSSELLTEIESYGPTVEKIISAVTNGKFKGGTYNELEKFVDKFGARLSGTQNLEDSIDYMLDLMNEYKLENVHGEDVQVPHWLRGIQKAEMVEPRTVEVEVLALGNSVGTPQEGIEAEVLVVRSFDELDQANFSAAANGKIVVFNYDFVSYGVSVAYRSQGARRAARHGAVAALVKSVTPFSMYTLHTGTQSYEANTTRIPALAITVEDARMFQRYQDREATSRNVIAELVGTEEPDKIVLVSGHIDSWDVGVGAMDDGGGAFISWYALTVLKSLDLIPRRTIRSILWTSEEPGLVGAYAYNTTHYEELDNHTFIMESDEGTFTPLGLSYHAGTKGGCILKEILKLLAPINATQTQYSSGGVGSDISIWTNVVPLGSLLNDNGRYFWFHHSEADTMDVMDPDALDKSTALWASVAYVVANLSEEFPRDFDTASANSAKSSLVKNILDNVAAKKIKLL